ncbi:GDSL-like protein [Leptospira broomii serovar Hurstbridge str. 5399]|uniref:GDSL-like protein n=1 Tax=Leptospira broomii serovar Hurstbridge str. 5399 TaxID=1049789 RepID=T0G9P9_9LEPT|nr:GDSL-type esterase/lipase family protein [Leptospira broomii]EQA43534.1 GDSL-like protein [Leptospira broomii serovar Hurstbridge str. 5399]
MKSLTRISLVFALLTSCASFRNDTIVDYYNPNFACSSSLGFRSVEFWTQYQVKYSEAVEFYKKENERIKTARIVFVGNSLIAGFPADLLSVQFPGSVNRGIPGDMTELLLERLESTVFALKPSYIVMEIGGNDIREGKCLDYIEARHREIISKIHGALPDTKIVILGIPPVLSKDVNSVSPVVNAWLSRVASENPNISFLDIWPYFRKKELPFLRDDLALEFGGKLDKIHVNESAYKIWAKQIKPFIK